MYNVYGKLVRLANGSLQLTLYCQMNGDVATSYVASSGTPPTVVCTSTAGSGLLKLVATVTPDTPVTEPVALTQTFVQGVAERLS